MQFGISGESQDPPPAYPTFQAASLKGADKCALEISSKPVGDAVADPVTWNNLHVAHYVFETGVTATGFNLKPIN